MKELDKPDLLYHLKNQKFTYKSNLNTVCKLHVVYCKTIFFSRVLFFYLISSKTYEWTYFGIQTQKFGLPVFMTNSKIQHRLLTLNIRKKSSQAFRYLAAVWMSATLSKLVKDLWLFRKVEKVSVAVTTHPMYSPMLTMAISVVNISRQFQKSQK